MIELKAGVIVTQEKYTSLELFNAARRDIELFNAARRDIERFINRPAIREAIENHKSNWIPESKGGEPNCRR